MTWDTATTAVFYPNLSLLCVSRSLDFKKGRACITTNSWSSAGLRTLPRWTDSHISRVGLTVWGCSFPINRFFFFFNVLIVFIYFYYSCTSDDRMKKGTFNASPSERKKYFFTFSEENVNGERAELDTLFLRTRSFIVVYSIWSFILFVVTNREFIIIIISM